MGGFMSINSSFDPNQSSQTSLLSAGQPIVPTPTPKGLVSKVLVIEDTVEASAISALAGIQLAHHNSFANRHDVQEPAGTAPEIEKIERVSQSILSPPILSAPILAPCHTTPPRSRASSTEVEEEKSLLSSEEKGGVYKLTQNLSSVPCGQIDCPSPLEIISRLYQSAKTPQERQACLRYAISHQQGNAPFTTRENEQLGYPNPLWAPQDKPGYIRTEHHRLFDVIKPWVSLHLGPFFERSYAATEVTNPKYNKKSMAEKKAYWLDKVLDYAKLTSGQVTSVLDTFYPKKTFKAVCITPADLAKSIEQILEEKNILRANAALKEVRKLKSEIPIFVFMLQIPGNDCVLAWGAEWKVRDPESKDTALLCSNLAKYFDPSVFSLLNETGSIPDRLAINNFLTTHAEPLLVDRLIDNADSSSSNEQTQADWERQIAEIANYTFKDDPGSELYRDAILKWDACFFQKHQAAFAYPLLCSQVGPWISPSAGVVQWAKAYQNICEIVMFSLDYLEKPSNEESKLESKDENLHVNAIGAAEMSAFKASLLRILDSSGYLSKLHTDVGLFPYAMGASFFVLDHLLKRPEFAASADIACISQSYFETQSLLDTFVAAKGDYFVLQKKSLLDDIEGIPDILVADIHTNNARGAELYQNDVAEWVGERLNKNPLRKMALVLDITLNYWSDDVIQNLLKVLSVYIKAGRLEIFMVQSLAKLVQFGADNYSGGLCIYSGNSKAPHPTFPLPIAKKVSFFNLLAENFSKLNATYFQCIRANTTWMYDKLKSRFSEIKHQCDSGSIAAGEKQKVNKDFRAADITLNTDEDTVYVAINFRPLLGMLALDPKKGEKMVATLRELILELARARGLPLTGRQSFGFSLSNMSNVLDSIRFSIGVETEAVFERYVDLIGEVVDLLSAYAAKSSKFDINAFIDNIRTAFNVVERGGSLDPISVGPIHYEDRANTDEMTAQIGFIEGDLSVKILENGQSLGYLAQDSRSLGDMQSAHAESSSNLFKLCFHLLSFKSTYLYSPYYGPSEIQGVFDMRYQFHKSFLANMIDLDSSCDESDSDMQAPLSIQFYPFKVNVHGKAFPSDKIVVRIPSAFGRRPVKIDRLDVQRRHDIWTKCVTHDCQTENHEKDTILLTFGQKKPSLDYQTEILKQKDLANVIKFLNGLDFENLPYPHDYAWGEEKPLERIHRLLNSLGGSIVYKLDARLVTMIQSIPSEFCRGALIGGMLTCLIDGPFRPISPKVAEFIAKRFLPRCNIDDDDLNQWIVKFDKHLSSNPAKIAEVYAHAIPFLPRIMKEYSTPSSLYSTYESSHLRHMADMLEPYLPELKAHMLGLESKIEIGMLAYIEELKIGNEINILGMHEDTVKNLTGILAENCVADATEEKEMNIQYIDSSIARKIQSYLYIDFNDRLNIYLRLLAKYPLTAATKAALFSALKTIPESLRNDWVSCPGFWYSPIDHEEMSLVGNIDVETFSEEHQQAITEFLIKTGCKQNLLDCLAKKPSYTISQAIRWAIITQDRDIFLQAGKVCQQILDAQQRGTKEAKEKILKQHGDLACFRYHLDEANPIQNQVLGILDQIFYDDLAKHAAALEGKNSRRSSLNPPSGISGEDESAAAAALEKAALEKAALEKAAREKAALDVEINGNALNQKNNSAYWYKGTDIYSILQSATLQKQLHDFNSLGSMTLAELAPKMDEIIASLKHKPALCIYNRGSLHWAAFCLLLQTDGTIEALYKDSLGASEPALEQLMQKKNRNIRFSAHPGSEQSGDGASCGIMAIQNARILAEQLAGAKRADFMANFANFGAFCTLKQAASFRKKVFPAFYTDGCQRMADEEAKKTRQTRHIRDVLHTEIQDLTTRLQQHCRMTVKAIKADEKMD